MNNFDKNNVGCVPRTKMIGAWDAPRENCCYYFETDGSRVE